MKQAAADWFGQQGLGYHNFQRESNAFSYYPYYHLTDTTKTYHDERLTFQLHQQYLDIYNSLAHEIYFKTAPDLSLSIGLAIQVSFPLGSKVTETYFNSDIRWNTAQRYWLLSPYVQSTVVSEAQKPVVFNWSIPVGFGIHCSKKVSVMFNVDYFKSYLASSLTVKNQSSEAVHLGLSVIHSLL